MPKTQFSSISVYWARDALITFAKKVGMQINNGLYYEMKRAREEWVNNSDGSSDCSLGQNYDRNNSVGQHY
ncbi:17458_t:CDS:2 [Dentiscutata erythropus]|uniref:17458_t:CDS:1 n=1 Tax=Dentiscutata erythropus TaxID=1348616 RepID=A0A9N8VDI9_9GLOM|nr:17458_t:CDS:2 [Dentiscutata erythropus]